MNADDSLLRMIGRLGRYVLEAAPRASGGPLPMRSVMRLLAVPALVGLACVGVALGAPLAADASTPRVVIVDNDAPTPAQGLDARTADWGYAPYHTTVMKMKSSPSGVPRVTSVPTTWFPSLEGAAHPISPGTLASSSVPA